MNVSISKTSAFSICLQKKCEVQDVRLRIGVHAGKKFVTAYIYDIRQLLIVHCILEIIYTRPSQALFVFLTDPPHARATASSSCHHYVRSVSASHHGTVFMR
jgi:hypothetical protein